MTRSGHPEDHGSEPRDDAVEREVRISAKPETVFPFFTDPDRMIRWKGGSAELSPHPGGIFRVNVTGNDIARGTYVEVVPFTRVVFTWGWEGADHPVPPGSSTVEITLTPDGEGGTLVRLRHSGLITAAQREEHTQGWDHFLPRLVAVANGGDPGLDPWYRGETTMG